MYNVILSFVIDKSIKIYLNNIYIDINYYHSVKMTYLFIWMSIMIVQDYNDNSLCNKNFTMVNLQRCKFFCNRQM